MDRKPLRIKIQAVQGLYYQDVAEYNLEDVVKRIRKDDGVVIDSSREYCRVWIPYHSIVSILVNKAREIT